MKPFARLFLASILALSAAPVFAFSCGHSHYRSVDNVCVHRPYAKEMRIDNETATCRDGTHSVSRHHRGTCSRHGGVAHWG